MTSPNVASQVDSQVPGKRNTIAVLVDHLDDLGWGYETQLRAGFEQACRLQDLNLIFVVGRQLEAPDPRSSIHNAIYHHIHPDSLQGAVLVASGLATYCGVGGVERLCEQLRPLPLCSVGVPIPGIPGIVVDNRPGMEAVVDHIIVDHGCRRVAFVAGPLRNPEAETRAQVYRQVLERHGLSYDPSLVVEGDFTMPTGAAATAALLDRGIQFDALIAANDVTAFGAIDTLKARGLRVPRDVRVVGFDDIFLARYFNPSLTTVRQPLERMGNLAIGLLRDQMLNKRVEELTCLPVELVVRKSCGCGHVGPRQIRAAKASDAAAAIELLRRDGAVLAQRLLEIPVVRASSMTDEIRDLPALLREELEGTSDAFTSLLEDLLDRAGAKNDAIDVVQSAVSVLREALRSVDAPSLAALWEANRCSIALANTHSQAQQRIDIEVTYQNLVRCGERIASVPDRTALRQALVEELPLVPLDNVMVSLCGDGGSGGFEPFLWLKEGQLIDGGIGAVSGTEVLSPRSYGVDGRHTWFALPITFEQQYLGIAVFQPRASLGVCGMFAEQLSFALKSIALHQEVVKKTALHERSVQERMAATERMEALSVMAGGVAHDLNSVLSPLVALPDVILGLLARLNIQASSDLDRLRNYVETLRSVGVRATETIKDLMTLGRRGHTQKAPLDLNWVVASCLSAEPSLGLNGGFPKVTVSLELYPEPLVVNATQHHLERAVSNLVRNAIEAIEGDGTVAVRTRHAVVSEPTGSQEPVAPGEYAIVSVTDTGHGIPEDLLERVFEPFFTRKNLGDSSGSGLGLSIVRGVAKEHQGYVDVSSQCGVGTTFTLYFPLASGLSSALRDGAPRADAF